MKLQRARAVMCVLTLVACGARTGLRVPDAASDEDVQTPVDVPRIDREVPVDRVFPDVPPPDVCVPGTYALPRAESRALLLLDESQSMGWSLSGEPTGTPTRWSIVRNALGEGLPRYSGRVSFGLWVFPGDNSNACGANTAPTLVPARDNVSAILRHMDTHGPNGLTPTRAALSAITAWIPTQPLAQRVRSIVLVTDGGPNCNAGLSILSCRCSVSTSASCGSAQLCLDDTATLEQFTALASLGVATYVLGIDGDRDPTLVEVLNRMAVAGGHPRPDPTGTRYFSIQRPSDLTAALDTIRPDVADCDRNAPFRFRDDAVRVELDGMLLTRDPSHARGWDWADDRSTLLRLYGDACLRSTVGEGTVTLRAVCP